MITPLFYQRRVFAALISCFHIVIILSVVGIAAIGGPSEAREAQVASIIYRTNEWILPLRNGIIPSKPPLYHWLTVLLAYVVGGGITPYVARLTSIIFSGGVLFLAVYTTLLFAEHGTENQKRNSRIIGLLTAAILTTTYGFEHICGDARVDMTHEFFSLLAVTIVLWRLTQRMNFSLSPAAVFESGDKAAFFAACGMAVLAKGPLGIVFPLLVVWACLSSIYGLRQTSCFLLKPHWSWLLFLAIAAPWYVLAYRKGGPDFIAVQLIFENLSRFTGGEYVNTQPPWFYLGSFLQRALPWSILFVYSLFERYRERAQSLPHQLSFARRRDSESLCLVWFAVGFIFLSISSGKRNAYLLSLYPALSIYLAFYLHRKYFGLAEWTQAKIRELMNSIALNARLLLVSVALILELTKQPLNFSNPVMTETWSWIGLHSMQLQLFLLGVIVLNILFTIYSSTRAFLFKELSLWISVEAVFVVMIWLGLGAKYHLKGFNYIATDINTVVPSSEKLAVIRHRRDESFDTVLYYLNREAEIVSPDTTNLPASTHILASREWFDTHSNNYQVTLEGTFNRIYDQYRNQHDREIVLFKTSS